MAQMSDLQEPSTGAGTLAVPLEEARRRIAEHEFWYHTIDVAPGVTTPGWFDLLHALDLGPFPDVRGKRCLDVGTFDGFWACMDTFKERQLLEDMYARGRPPWEVWRNGPRQDQGPRA